MIQILSPFRVVFLFLLVIVLSLLIIPYLSVNWLPKQTGNIITLNYYLPFSSPDVVEQEVTATLENYCSQLPQLRKIKSISQYNAGKIQLYFDKSADMKFKRFEIASLVRQVYPRLPSNTSYPILNVTTDENKEEASPIYIFSINASSQPYQIKELTEKVFNRELSTIGGLKAIVITGANNLQIVINYDIQKCLAWDIQPSRISSKLKSYYSKTFPGSISASNGVQFFLQTSPPSGSLSSMENIPLKSQSGRILRLKDIASISYEEEMTERFFRINGKNYVTLAIYAREGENKIILGKKVKGIVEKAKHLLPNGYNVRLEYDDTTFIEKEIDKNYHRISLSILILLGFITLVYRSLRYSATLLIALIANVSLTILATAIFRISIHLYTIAGLAIAFGIMIDNAIVMIDYYRQYKNRNVFKALLGSTLSTIAALCLIFFLPENDVNNLTDFSIAIIVALGSSLIVCLWFIPGLYQLIFHRNNVVISKKGAKIKYGRIRIKVIHFYFALINFLAKYRRIYFFLIILLFGLPVFMLPTKWEGDHFYHRWFNETLGSSLYQETIRPISDKWLGGTLRNFIMNIYDRSGYRSPGKTKLYIVAKLPFGTTSNQMNSILTGFEQYLEKVKSIDKYVTKVESGQYGTIEITFPEAVENSGLPYQLKFKLIEKSIDLSGVEWQIYGVGQGFSNTTFDEIPNFKVIMKGYNYDELENQAKSLAAKLVKHERINAVDINDRLNFEEDQSQEFILNIDQSKLTVAGTNKLEIVGKLGIYTQTNKVNSLVVLDDKQYPLLLKEKSAEEFSNYDLINKALKLDSDRQVKIRDFGILELGKTSQAILKEDRQYVRVVSFDYMGTSGFGSDYLNQVLKQMNNEMPIGFEALREKWQDSKEANRQKFILILILILAIFCICSILFENLIQPLYIISTIPLSFIGLFIIYYLGDFYFDQGGYAAFIMLGGLVSNAAIFIVNDLNNLIKHQEKINRNVLLIKAISNRSRTVILTIISTCCGLIPFLINGPTEIFWFALAIGVIGGLLFSLIAIFFILPVLLWKKSA